MARKEKEINDLNNIYILMYKKNNSNCIENENEL